MRSAAAVAHGPNTSARHAVEHLMARTTIPSAITKGSETDCGSPYPALPYLFAPFNGPSASGECSAIIIARQPEVTISLVGHYGGCMPIPRFSSASSMSRAQPIQ
jgi:hypothetical protein